VRLSGDSPLLDPTLVDMAVEMYRGGEYDLVTNVMPATYPPGQSVEVLRAETYRHAYALFETPQDYEHVTPYLYNHSASFRIRNFTAPHDLRDINLCVDTPADMDRFKAIVSRMDMPHTSYHLEDIIRIYRSLP
jgi:spore coat polysaccharide biosynthesis protein SpsF (cytidylyltransferase family)